MKLIRRRILLALLVLAGLWVGFVAVRSATDDPILGTWKTPAPFIPVVLEFNGDGEMSVFLSDAVFNFYEYNWSPQGSTALGTYRITNQRGEAGEAFFADEGSKLIVRFPGEDPSSPAHLFQRPSNNAWFHRFWADAKEWWLQRFG